MSRATAILRQCHIRHLVPRPGRPPILEIEPLRFIPVPDNTKETNNG